MNKKTNKLRWFKFPDTIGPKAVIEDNLEEEGFNCYEVDPSPNQGYFEVLVGISQEQIEDLGTLRYEWGFDEDSLSFYEVDAKTKLYIEVA